MDAPNEKKKEKKKKYFSTVVRIFLLEAGPFY